jgi:glycosyltransferase involved in cell wall biosynthesis
VRVGLHVDQLWFRAPGGIGTYVRELWSSLDRLDDADVEVLPFTARWREERADARPDPPVVAGATQQLRLPIRVLYPAWATVRRPRLPRRFGHLDVIHATNHVAIPPARHGQALVVTVHDLAFERFPDLFPPRWVRLYRRSLAIARREADVVLAPSEATARDLEGHGIPRSKIRVIPLACRPPLDQRSVTGGRVPVLEPGRPFLLAVGTLEPRKNLPRLVRAFRRAAQDADLPHALVLAGPTGWHQEALAAELDRDATGRVHRLGSLHPVDLDAVYGDAAAVAYVSLYEGFGLPVLEALARGLPTLASDSTSIPEVAGEAALLVDPEDEDAIAAGIVRILTDDALRADLARAGPVRAGSYSWASTARATLGAYEQATGR